VEMSKTKTEGEERYGEIVKTLYQRTKDVSTVDRTGGAVCGLCGIERERHRWTERGRGSRGRLVNI